MSKWFYSKLAINNIKKNSRTYIPYILTCIGMVAMFYMICSLSQNSGISKIGNIDTLVSILALGAWVTGIFAIVFLFYTNSFLMKRRKKEFGLYNILGMEKRHLSKVVFCETVFITILSLLIGLAIGILLDKAMYLLLLSMFGFEVTLGFEVSIIAIVVTCILFGGIFLLIFLRSMGQIHLSKPIELLKGGQVGEREPKTKLILAIIGLLCLSAGYYISITTTNPLQAISLFFIAVILVIIGTYLLFIAGSIALLKLLRKNKGYYYKTKHFTAVSGMIYRMKQNAAGLASICILSTAVLVMISSTLSLYIGMEDILKTNYPRSMNINTYNSDQELTFDEAVQKTNSWVESVSEKTGLQPINEIEYNFLSLTGTLNGNEATIDRYSNIDMVNNPSSFIFVPLEDYNRYSENKYSLNDNEALVFSNRSGYEHDSFKIFDKDFSIKATLTEFMGNNITASSITSTFFFVVNDTLTISELEQKQKEVYDTKLSNLTNYYAFDLDASDEQIIAFYNSMFDMLHEDTYVSCNFACREESKNSFLGIYGGLFFIGVFLGAVFIMATILIIYYKQISEGYDDRERFEIMQKVGMSKYEIKKSIHSQVLTVFFLPLVTAGIHIAFAFPLIRRLLELLNLTNTTLFVICTIASFIVFGIIYWIVYSVTAKVYYKIVS